MRLGSGLAALLLAAFFGSAPSALADWRDDIGTFRLALPSAEPAGEAMVRLEPFRLAVQEKLGLPVEFRIDSDMERFIVNQSQRPSEYLILPASAYATIWLRCECIEPVAVAQGTGGSKAYRGVLIVRSGSGYEKPGDLVGKKVFALSRNSIAGYAMPARAIAGPSGGNDADWQFPKTAEEALTDFVSGQGDALAGWIVEGGDPSAAAATTLSRLVELGGKESDFTVIWQSEPIPNRVHAVRKALDAEAKNSLREMLVGLESADPVVYDTIEGDHAGGFVSANQSDFTGLLRFLGKDAMPAAGEKESGQSETDSAATGSTSSSPAEQEPRVIAGDGDRE